jgi:tetrahydromethanopterin S-methyltransferase subunit D
MRHLFLAPLLLLLLLVVIAAVLLVQACSHVWHCLLPAGKTHAAAAAATGEGTAAAAAAAAAAARISKLCLACVSL